MNAKYITKAILCIALCLFMVLPALAGCASKEEQAEPAVVTDAVTPTVSPEKEAPVDTDKLIPSEEASKEERYSVTVSAEKEEEFLRLLDEEEGVDTVRKVAGNGDVSVYALRGEEDLKDSLTDLTGVVRVSEKDETVIPKTDLAATYKGEKTDDNGNMLMPFDVLYPDAFESKNYDTTQVLLKMSKSFAGELTDDLRLCGIKRIDKMFDTEKGTWYSATLDENAEISDTVKKARSLSTVLVVDYDYIYETEDTEISGTPGPVTEVECFINDVHNNDLLKYQYYLNQCGIQDAWRLLQANGYPAGGLSSVVVAVIDTGVDYTHPDLQASMWINRAEIPNNGIDDDNNGYIDDYYGCSTIGSTFDHNGDPMDDHGHGTHVAGIIGASNNRFGVVGVAYNARIMAVKAGQNSGVFNQSDIAEAILYAYTMGADVINMSFGGTSISIPVQDALTSAYTTATLVAAAGNNTKPNEPTDQYPKPLYEAILPASLSYVIGVTSVDPSGAESVFSNWDAIAFNGVEYEVSAPGENILSTLPDGRYGYLSGTSMATPIVSGIAALLRTYFTDRDVYPSKFIAAQIAATSNDIETCCDVRMHEVNKGPHNLLMIVNAYAALIKLPKPDVTLYDWFIWDDTELSGKNNGDGVADAGETIKIAIIVRNRWGMSKNTVVTANAFSTLGVANPYIDFLDNSIDLGEVGTYSTKSTLLRDDDGQIITGVSDPITIKIADNCPNNYYLKINLSITCGNALDENDHSVYTSSGSITLIARNGTILSGLISEDTTLTNDRYYILTKTCVIAKNATLRIEPGTQIQFGSPDALDPYADYSYPQFTVRGSLICEGSVEDPVKLFPYELNQKFCVRIENKGKVCLEYADVTDPRIEASIVDHCIFRTEQYSEPFVMSPIVSNSVYYHMYLRWLYAAEVYTNCVFYGTSLVGGYDYNSFDHCVFFDGIGGGTNYSVFEKTFDPVQCFRNSATGTTYLQCSIQSERFKDIYSVYSIRSFAQLFEGDICCIETEEELEYLTNSGICGVLGVSSLEDTWMNGQTVGEIINCLASTSSKVFGIDSGSDDWLGYVIIEIPGSIYCEEIQLPQSEAIVDLESTYTITPSVLPSSFDISSLIYVSDDTSVLTVSDSGVVTPLRCGTAMVRVYSPDYEVYSDIRIVVNSDSNNTTENGFSELPVYSSIDNMATLIAPDRVFCFVYNNEYSLAKTTAQITNEEESIIAFLTFENGVLTVTPSEPLKRGNSYSLTVEEGTLIIDQAHQNAGLIVAFSTVPESTRSVWTISSAAQTIDELNAFPRFHDNAILNDFNSGYNSDWTRPYARDCEDYTTIPFGRIWWGTENETIIEKVTRDFDEVTSLSDLDTSGYFTKDTIPESIYPFITDLYILNANGEKGWTVGNETITVVLEFNRDMDVSVSPRVRFGSSEPYAEYEVSGAFVTPRRWEGTYTLKTTIENGRQFFNIEGGRAADDHWLTLYEHAGRFCFELDTTAAMAMTMNATATETGVALSWVQDDYDTLFGYNVYRSDREDGLYTKLNRTVLPIGEESFFDDTVEPGKVYYYNFTVVLTDMSESKPSGKVSLRSLDTMAPDIYHTPVRTGYTDTNLIINATITDNLNVSGAKVYYRTVGQTAWKSVTMSALNSKYTAVIRADNLTTDGIEYYIEAFDGLNYTYKGKDSPYQVSVQLAVDASTKGDVNGDGMITNYDALMIVQAVNDLINLTEEQFLRADLDDDGELSAYEALVILKYVSGEIDSVLI